MLDSKRGQKAMQRDWTSYLTGIHKGTMNRMVIKNFTWTQV